LSQDETVEDKAGKYTDKIGYFYSGKLCKVIKSISIGCLSLIALDKEESCMVDFEQMEQNKVNNSAGVYILTLNSNNSVSALYPCAVDANNPVPGATSTMPDAAKSKDIIIANRRTNPVAAQDINGFTTFPTPDFSTTPPTPNYFTITGTNKTPENFCVILSKSVLDMDLMKKQLEAQTGNMDERLAKVFKEEAMTYADGQVTPESNKVSFNASSSTKNVLPLVFYIKR
jgi:hypothetical protein